MQLISFQTLVIAKMSLKQPKNTGMNIIRSQIICEIYFPDNFIIVDAPKFFSDIYYRTDVLSKVDIDIQLKPLIPVNFDSWEISTTLHGGLEIIYFKWERQYLSVRNIIYLILSLAHGIYGMVVVNIPIIQCRQITWRT